MNRKALVFTFCMLFFFLLLGFYIINPYLYNGILVDWVFFFPIIIGLVLCFGVKKGNQKATVVNVILLIAIPTVFLMTKPLSYEEGKELIRQYADEPFEFNEDQFFSAPIEESNSFFVRPYVYYYSVFDAENEYFFIVYPSSSEVVQLEEDFFLDWRK
ncbi:hypothetical protein [Bacillus alkalicellulosilyticus]|uniref:hypothetical protein n=1 Tax=Alkalihalobacterium alkalicellulosilyticum TaxID=1912214 RepID=UPI0011177193|nr:hypothetical protein [Bacillus alkalicellulosilyticus]